MKNGNRRADSKSFSAPSNPSSRCIGGSLSYPVMESLLEFAHFSQNLALNESAMHVPSHGYSFWKMML